MARQTRQSSRLAAQGTADPALDDQREEPNDTLLDPVALLQTHVSSVVDSARALQRGYKKLEKENQTLQSKLADAQEQLEAEAQPKRGLKRSGPTVPHLQKQVSQLKARVRELEKSRAKDKRKIASLQAKEIKRDAQELHDQAEFEVGDAMPKMRKLLREFHDLMLANSLDSSEECTICMTEMEVGSAMSLPCQHVFCTDCVKQVEKSTKDEDDKFPCPSCRLHTSLEECDVIKYTSSSQWDALLEIANRSAKLDRRRGELDTSDEEEEEALAANFVDDEQSEDAISTISTAASKTQVEDEEAAVSQAGPSRLGRRVLRHVPSSPDDEPVASGSGSGSATGTTLHNPVQVHDHNNDDEHSTTALLPVTPRPSESTVPSYLQSPTSEKRRRLEELADERLAKDKRRRYGI